MTRGFQTLSSLPMISQKRAFSFQDFELCSLVLSALLWKKFNGPVVLYTDSVVYDILDRFQLLDVWDEIDYSILDQMPSDINHSIFWASSKIFALHSEKTPIAMIDNDLFVWKHLDIQSDDIVVLHREPFNECYVSKHKLGKRSGYNFDSNWNWHVWPCNTAFAFFPNQEFKDYYTSCSIDFMLGNNQPNKAHSSQMVFAEQRILSMCARYKGVKIKSLIKNPFNKENDIFTHIWGAKEIAIKDSLQKELLTRSILSHIRYLSPKYYVLLVALYSHVSHP